MHDTQSVLSQAAELHSVIVTHVELSTNTEQKIANDQKWTENYKQESRQFTTSIRDKFLLQITQW